MPAGGGTQTTERMYKMLLWVKSRVRAHEGSLCCSNSYSFSVSLEVIPE